MNELYAGQIIRQIPLFNELSSEEMAELSTFVIGRSYRKKSVIFNEGGEVESVYFIQTGLIKTYKTDIEGSQHIVSFLKKGDMFPHAGLFANRSYPATAEAITPTVLLALPVNRFRLFLEKRPGVAIAIINVMGAKIAELQRKLQDFSHHDIYNRGQMFLLQLAESHGKAAGGAIQIAVPMTHQDLAAAIGTTRETASRMLGRLKREGILEASRSGFVVHDLEALRAWRV